jgi:hypothetical protein
MDQKKDMNIAVFDLGGGTLIFQFLKSLMMVFLKLRRLTGILSLVVKTLMKKLLTGWQKSLKKIKGRS